MKARNAPIGRHAAEMTAVIGARARGSGDTQEFYESAREIGTLPPFGYLLTLDCYDCLPRLMRDVGAAYWCLETLAASLNMHKQAPPFVFVSPAQFHHKAGISGWVPLIESGIQIHTLAPKNFVSLDIYCCHRIDSDVAIAVVKDCYAPQEIEMNELKRGKRYYGVRSI